MKKLHTILLLLLFIVKLGSLHAQSNTSYGNGAGSALTSGSSNSFFGYRSGQNTTSGNFNTFIGSVSGRNNTTGYANVGVGFASGILNTTGDKNTFLGMYSGYYNNGNDNVYIGYQSAFSNQYGSDNVIIGSAAGFNNKASWNVYIGSESGRENTTGHSNVFVGEKSGYSNTTGRFNTFIGTQSGEQSTTTYSNTFIGSYTGHYTTTGEGNVFLGSSTGYDNTTGDNNTYLGRLSGYNNQTGSGNVFIGSRAGYYETGSNMLYINNNSSTPLIYGDFTNNTVSIQYKYTGTTYKLYVPGQIYATSVASPSDERFKKNIKDVNGALEGIKSLSGVTYEFKNVRSDEARQFPKGNQYGLLAQQVQEAFPDLVIEDEEGYLAINYMGMIPVLVEAMKELSGDSIGHYQAQLSALREENLSIREELNELKKMIKGNTIDSSFGKEAYLNQNQPNPSDGNTRIQYSLPDSVQKASILIYDLQGKQVMDFKNLNSGSGEIDILNNTLDAGMYIYSLVADGRIVDTKRMILSK